MRTEEALFIVSSPFQALCAQEAISHYRIGNAIFLLFDNEITRKMILPIVSNLGDVHLVKLSGNITYGTIKALRTFKQKKFSTIFNGDYFSYSHYISTIYLAKGNAEIIYLDDGNSTLLIAPPVSLKRGRTPREKKYYKFWDVIALLKRTNSRFFSIYNLRGCPLPVDFNSFSSIVSKHADKRGVYIIGTNSDMMEFKQMSYEEHLIRVDAYVREQFPDEPICYCPHRRDSHDYNALLRHLHWTKFDTECNVEIDSIKKSLYPIYVIGFGSTALLTLKRIFPKTQIDTIYLDLASDQDNNEYRIIEEYYSENGINVITL